MIDEREKTDQRCTREHQTANERSKSAPLCSIDQSIPPEDIEVGRAVQMPRVNAAGERIDKIVLNEKGIPGVDEGYGDIVSDLKVTIQSKEPLEATVHGLVEGDGIETVEQSLPKEILVVVSGEVCRLAKTWGSLVWSSTTSAGKLQIEHMRGSKK